MFENPPNTRTVFIVCRPGPRAYKLTYGHLGLRDAKIVYECREKNILIANTQTDIIKELESLHSIEYMNILEIIPRFPRLKATRRSDGSIVPKYTVANNSIILEKTK